MSVQVAEVRVWPAELRTQQGRTITVQAATYGRAYDLGGFVEQLEPGVFAKSIREGARALPLHINHEHHSIPIGKAVAWDDDQQRLIGEFELDTRADAQEAARLVDSGLLSGVSVGFLGIIDDWDRSGSKPTVRRREARLLEVSLCSVPAYDDAQVLALRSAGHPEMPTTRVVATPRLAEARAWLESIRRDTPTGRR